MKFTELNGCSLSMGSLYMPVVELEEEDHNVDAKLQDVKFKSINLLKVRDQSRGEIISASKSSIRRFVITEKAPTRAFSW